MALLGFAAAGAIASACSGRLKLIKLGAIALEDTDFSHEDIHRHRLDCLKSCSGMES